MSETGKTLTPAEKAEMKAHVRTYFETQGKDYDAICAGVAARSARAQRRRVAAEREYWQEQELRRRSWLPAG